MFGTPKTVLASSSWPSGPGREFLISAPQVRIFMCISVIPVMSYLPTRLAECLMNPEISHNIRMLPDTPGYKIKRKDMTVLLFMQHALVITAFFFLCCLIHFVDMFFMVPTNFILRMPVESTFPLFSHCHLYQSIHYALFYLFFVIFILISFLKLLDLNIADIFIL